MPDPDSSGPSADRLHALLAEAGLPQLPPETIARLLHFVSLFVRWNGRTNLSAIRDVDGIQRRHIVESIAVSSAIPQRLASLLDYGSGGGLPGIPIALLHPEIHVTLAESQNKKAAFLREAVRVLSLNATVHAGRAETLPPGSFDCVTLRAVDDMRAAVASAGLLVRPGGFLALMTTTEQLPTLQSAAGPAFTWSRSHPLPFSFHGILALAGLETPPHPDRLT